MGFGVPCTIYIWSVNCSINIWTVSSEVTCSMWVLNEFQYSLDDNLSDFTTDSTLFFYQKCPINVFFFTCKEWVMNSQLNFTSGIICLIKINKENWSCGNLFVFSIHFVWFVEICSLKLSHFESNYLNSEVFCSFKINVPCVL